MDEIESHALLPPADFAQRVDRLLDGAVIDADEHRLALDRYGTDPQGWATLLELLETNASTTPP